VHTELAKAARCAKRMVTLHIYHASMVGAVKGLNLVLPKKVMGGVCPLRSKKSVSLSALLTVAR
jgi:hypothetical protein